MRALLQSVLRKRPSSSESTTVTHVQESRFLALDIGTDSVKALVCTADHGEGKVIVHGVGVSKQRLGDMYNGGVIDIDGVSENATAAITDAEMMANFSPEQVVIGIAGEMVKGVTNTVEYIREKSQEKISLDELRHLLHKIQWRAYEKARRALAVESGYHEIETKLVHTNIVEVHIDGYRVSNPIGFKGRHVQMSIFNAFAPLVHYDALVSIADELKKELLSIIVEPYAVAHSCDLEDGGELSSIYIDIGGGSTDIGLVVNGGVVGTKVFGIGGRVFTRRLAKHFHIPFAEAEKLKLDFALGKLKGDKATDVGQVIEADVTTWLEALHHALYSFDVAEYFPGRIYLSGGGVLLPQIQERLSTQNWYKGLRFLRRPKVAFLAPSSLNRVVDQTGKLTSQQYITPMALANIGYELAGEDRILTKVLKQVTRVISN